MKCQVCHARLNCVFSFAENADITSALSKLTEPTAAVPISKLSVSNMVHTARKHIRRHRRDESPLNTNLLNSILLVSTVSGNWRNWHIRWLVDRLLVCVLIYIFGFFFFFLGEVEFRNVCVLQLDIWTFFFFLAMLMLLLLIISTLLNCKFTLCTYFSIFSQMPVWKSPQKMTRWRLHIPTPVWQQDNKETQTM